MLLTYELFHRYFNSILPPPPISPPCSQHLWEALGYLPIGEMGNVARRGIFMWWLESEEEWFWPFKSFLKLKNNIAKFPQWGLKWNFAGRRIFFTRWSKFKVRGQVIEYNRIFFVFKNFVENDVESFTRPVLRFK